MKIEMHRMNRDFEHYFGRGKGLQVAPDVDRRRVVRSSEDELGRAVIARADVPPPTKASYFLPTQPAVHNTRLRTWLEPLPTVTERRTRRWARPR